MPRNVSVEKTFDAFATQTFAASFTPDISNVATVRVLMTGNITALNAPTGRNWGRMTLIFEQDTTGGRTVTWNTGAYSLAALGYDWQPMDIGNGVSSITLQYNATTSMWDMLSSFGGDLILGGTSAGIKWLGSSASLKLNASGFLQASNYQAVTAMYAPTLHGSTSSGGNLTLSSTSNATKGKVFFGTSSLSAFDQVNNRLGVGNVSPTQALDVTGQGVFSSTVTCADPSASTHAATKNYVDTQIGARIKGRAASNQTGMASSSYADVTSLAVSLPSTGYYRFKAFIPVQAVSGTSPTITFGVTGPTAVVCQYTVTVQTATAGTVNTFGAGAYLQNTTQSGVVTTGTTYGALIDGFVEVSATGTLKVQYKCGGVTPSFTVFTGAMFMAEKIVF